MTYRIVPVTSQAVGNSLSRRIPSLKPFLTVRQTVNGNVAVVLAMPEDANTVQSRTFTRIHVRQALNAAGYSFTQSNGRFYVTGKREPI